LFAAFLIMMRYPGEAPSDGFDVFPWEAVAILVGIALLSLTLFGLFKLYQALDRWSKSGPE
jgi:hypothetical protein